ncbi:hypothetical protein [Halobacillus alkaliphilus]|uniref:hypothetical protein n=1 Tax=Halobacillus alkaliphilus TaxID=396056 RepID=UPI0015871AB3|nr:hypothetical protein [Halobacillus alkaliphilus]
MAEKFIIPVEVIFLPPAFLIQLYDLSVFGRANLVPILLLAYKKYQVVSSQTHDLSELSINHKNWSSKESFFEDENRSNEWKQYFSELLNVMNHNETTPAQGIKRPQAISNTEVITAKYIKKTAIQSKLRNR